MVSQAVMASAGSATEARSRSVLDPANRVSTFFADAPVAIPGGLFSFDMLERIIEDVERNARQDPRAKVMCRQSAKVPEDEIQAPIADLVFRGRLESRLLRESMHIMITGVETYDRDIARLLTAFTDYIRDRCSGAEYGVFRPMATLFISSPGTVARLHNDPEHGWLTHLWGNKILHVYPMDEARLHPPAVPPQQRPLYSREATRRFMEELSSQEQVFRLSSGQTVHTPSLAPHWVEAGPQINLSLTFTCFTATALMRQKVKRVGEWARRKGLRLQSYGGGGWADRMKAGLFDVLEGMNRIKLV